MDHVYLSYRMFKDNLGNLMRPYVKSKNGLSVCYE